MSGKLIYKKSKGTYALYLHKGVWKESASVKNSDLNYQALLKQSNDV